MSVKHRFVSAVADAGNASEVEPTQWNDTHEVVGTGYLNLGDLAPASPGTYDEEFEGTADTLPTNWSYAAAPSGSDAGFINSRWPSLLTVEGTGNTSYTLTRASFTAAATFGIWAKFHMGPLTAADATSIRMYASNSGETEQRGVNWRATGAQASGARGLKIITSVETVWATEVGPGFVTTLYMGMTRASNNWTAWISNDGISWIHLNNSAQSHILTVDKLRFLIRTASSQSLVGMDWIRYRTDNAFPRP